MKTNPSILSDEQLVGEIKHLVSDEFISLSELLSLLAEMDDRMLYARLGFSSLFGFVVQELHLSEDAAYKRIHAARAAKRFPLILSLISEGRVNLTTVTILSPILTDENHEELLTKAVHKSKIEVERIRASYAPKPDIPDMIRSLPLSTRSGASSNSETENAAAVQDNAGSFVEKEIVHTSPPSPARRDAIAPLSEERVKFQFTGSERLRGKIERAKELLRHKYPAARLEDVIDEALNALLAKKDPEKKIGRKEKNTASKARPKKSGVVHTRYIPQHVKDIVWQRDQGRCRYIAADGRRCDERGGLEFDHVKPWAKGGCSDDPQNIRLLCHAHNQLAMKAEFGEQKRYP